MATTNLILTNTNYTDPSLTNSKEYSTGGNYACNYPLDATISFTVTGTVGSKIITCSSGDFLDLLGCDIQNNNVPVKKWITGVTGEILEIDYIKSSTEAVLKAPCSYALAGVVFIVVNYFGNPQVEETTIENTDNFGASSVLANSKIGPITINVGPNQTLSFGQEPITVDLGTTASGCQLTIKYL